MPAAKVGADEQTFAPPTRLAALLGALWLFLVITKIGNPVVLHAAIAPPEGLAGLLTQAWPIEWGFALALGGLGALWAARAFCRPLRAPGWIEYALVAWCGWVLVSAWSASEARQPDGRVLVAMTTVHLLLCVACYAAGWCWRGRDTDGRWLWGGLVAAMAVAVVLGFEQHFGGLEATRRYVYEQVDVSQLPAEYRKRLASDRIFACFLYPNTFAGAILLFSPLVLVRLWQSARARGTAVSVGLIGAASVGLAACLYWTGSKSGWLILLGLLGAGLAVSRLPRRALRVILPLLVVVGVVVFFWRFSGYFARGATSVGARFDYWEAAFKTATAQPFTGSGPGSFGRVYARIKRPESEMARLTHNDYLQQASDSGWPAAILYAVFWAGVLTHAWRVARSSPSIELRATALGLAAFAAQNAVEFGLYIPALAWPGFFIAGWLAATSMPERAVDHSLAHEMNS